MERLLSRDNQFFLMNERFQERKLAMRFAVALRPRAPGRKYRAGPAGLPEAIS
jgi:hypothetical protein